MRKLFTVGYQGATTDAVISTLLDSNVDILIDVRAVAASRKPGFSKTAIGQRLADAGITYLHMPGLGDPKPGRIAARQGDLSTFKRIFRNHLRKKASQTCLNQLIDTARKSNVCLFCFESDADVCHRSLIVRAMQLKKPFQVDHLVIREQPVPSKRVNRVAYASGFAIA